MSAVKKTERYKYSPDYGNNGLRHDRGRGEDGSWNDTIGAVRTRYGFVNARAWHQIDSRGVVLEGSRVEIMFSGYEYCRWFHKAYSDRYLVTLARRFAEEVFNSNGEL